MINISELRLFNEIDTPVGYKRVMGITITSDNKFLIMTGDKSGYYSLELCNGIPLTPEIFELFGFKKEKDGEREYAFPTYSILKLQDYIAIEEDGIYQRVTDIDGYFDQRVGVKLEFLHQLQNRYYSITGEELNVKL